MIMLHLLSIIYHPSLTTQKVSLLPIMFVRKLYQKYILDHQLRLLLAHQKNSTMNSLQVCIFMSLKYIYMFVLVLFLEKENMLELVLTTGLQNISLEPLEMLSLYVLV